MDGFVPMLQTRQKAANPPISSAKHTKTAENPHGSDFEK